jgi:hypothetical protein
VQHTVGTSGTARYSLLVSKNTGVALEACVVVCVMFGVDFCWGMGVTPDLTGARRDDGRVQDSVNIVSCLMSNVDGSI